MSGATPPRPAPGPLRVPVRNRARSVTGTAPVPSPAIQGPGAQRVQALVLRLEADHARILDALRRAVEDAEGDRHAPFPYRSLVGALVTHVDDLFALVAELHTRLERERSRQIESLVTILLEPHDD